MKAHRWNKLIRDMGQISKEKAFMDRCSAASNVFHNVATLTGPVPFNPENYERVRMIMRKFHEEYGDFTPGEYVELVWWCGRSESHKTRMSYEQAFEVLRECGNAAQERRFFS